MGATVTLPDGTDPSSVCAKQIIVEKPEPVMAHLYIKNNCIIEDIPGALSIRRKHVTMQRNKITVGCTSMDAEVVLRLAAKYNELFNNNEITITTL